MAEPDGVEPESLDLYRSELADFPTEDKVALALNWRGSRWPPMRG